MSRRTPWGSSWGWRCGERTRPAPFRRSPILATRWQPEGQPARQPHEYVRDGTAKLLTLFHPADGQVRVKGVTSSTNDVLHGWLKEEQGTIVAALPEPTVCLPPQENRARWESWQQGLSVRPTLPAALPPLKLLLVLDNLAGHKTLAFVCWLFAHGIMPLYTPVGGSWLNMTESVQRILKRRALEGQEPQTTGQIIAWLEATAQGSNAGPTPFVWGGKRQVRRQRAWERRHRLGGSGVASATPCLVERSWTNGAIRNR